MSKHIGNFGALAALTAATFAAGCGDGAICPSDIVVVFQQPTTESSISAVNDTDAATPGIQRDVTVRSNLKKGDEFTLTVTDSSAAVSQFAAQADANGDVVFSDVTFPAGEVSLGVTGTSGKGCGEGSDELIVSVITEADCTLAIANGPIENAFFAPIPVLNASNDGDGELPNFQAQLDVMTNEGFSVEIFVLDVNAGTEASIGTADADGAGVVSFSTTLAQGRQAIRATCRSGAINEASATNTVEVDTVVPSCSLDVPADGSTITPDFDADNDIGNGIQMTWTGNVDDGDENDTEGESARFFRDALEFAGLDIDEDGNSSAAAEFTSPGDFAVSFSTQDHAGNSCTAGHNVPVILEGCAISIDEPSAIVLADSDAGANGLQTDVGVTVGAACAGLDVFVDCGFGEVSGTVAASGISTVANVTLANNAASQGQTTCNARVVNSANFQTTDSRPVSYDTLAPDVNLVFVSPAGLACGEAVARTVANDATGTLTDGFQIAASVSSPLAATREISVTNSGGTATQPAPAGGVSTPVTLLAGDNDIRALATDENGNSSSSGACNVLVEDITVAFEAPVSNGLLGASDGTVSGGSLELPVCATISEADVTVVLSVDGGADLSTSLNAGTTFCTDAPVSLTAGNHSLVATATSNSSTRQGTSTQNVDVDLAPPGTVGNLLLSSSDHQTLDVSWDPIADADHYLVRYRTDGNFSADPQVFLTQGTEWPGAIINETTQIVGDVDAGSQYVVGLVAVDEAGNMSAVVNSNAVTPIYDDTGAFSPSLADFNAGTQRGPNFGIRSARGDYNGDGFDDVAIAAPFNQFPFGAVYVYFGSATGVPTSGLATSDADVVIQSAGPFAFGNAIARVNWTGGAADGLAIGAPFPTGAVYLYHGDTLTNAVAPLSEADRDVFITPGGGGTDYFTGARLGWSLASGQVDANGTYDDLIIGAPRGGINGGKSATNPGGDGGVVIIYGDDLPAGQDTITLATDGTENTQGMGVVIFENPQTTVNSSTFANEVAYLGDTRNGNGVGDIGIAYVADATADGTANNRIYVLRGRTLVTPGVDFVQFLAGTDLTVVNPTPDTTNEFGISMGSIEDQNGDGFRDIVIGARLDNGTSDGTSANEGRLWVVSGSRTGTLTLNSAADYLLKVSSLETNTRRLGGGIANNALAPNPDVNGDGIEDLVTTAGGGDMRVWYGPLPAGDVAGTSADYNIVRPVGFTNTLATGFPAMCPATWVGDVNGDGLTDIGRGDWSAGPDAKGIYGIVWDE